MRKSFTVLSAIFLVSLVAWLTTTCKKEEYVIVYSKVSTIRAFNITATSASLEGSIDSLTSAAHDEFGFCYDTLASPTVYKLKKLATGIVQTGTFSASLSGLIPAKTYHVRAFIKDNKKYIYGSDITFSTLALEVPTVTTNQVTNITATTAYCGGSISDEGDKAVIAKGVCYDTIANPTVLKSKTMDGWGSGSFTSNLVNLIPNKAYYARAYAISEAGIGYGSQRTFTTLNALYSFHDNFDNNINKWDTGSYSGGYAKIASGNYEISYNEEGYLYLMYINFPDFKTVSTKDFEISTSVKIASYQELVTTSTYVYGGLIWNTDDTHFRYFIVRKGYTLDRSYKSKGATYSYAIGEYSGGYTTWKDYTSFTGKDSTKLSIKKAGSKCYFFVDDAQVYSRDYSTISYEGVGFLIQDATVKADFLYIDQRTYKSAPNIEIIELKSLPGGHSILRSFSK